MPCGLGRMGFLIVFDVTDPDSFSKATELFDLVKDFAEYRNVRVSGSMIRGRR